MNEGKTMAERSFDMMAENVKKAAELLIESHFGERCKEYSYPCPVCLRYRMLDRLIESPYVKETQ